MSSIWGCGNWSGNSWQAFSAWHGDRHGHAPRCWTLRQDGGQTWHFSQAEKRLSLCHLVVIVGRGVTLRQGFQVCKKGTGLISLDVVVFWRKEETMVNEWQVRNQKIGRSCSTCSVCMQYNITLWFWGAQLKRFVFMNMFHFWCSQ